VGVPGLDTAHHHPVPQVVHAWRSGASGRGPAQLPAQHGEGVVGGVVADVVAAVGAEERRTVARRAAASLPLGCIVTQWRQGAGVQRHQPHPAAFPGADGEHPAGQVDAIPARAPRWRDPASLPITGRVLAIPAKRFDRPVLGYLSREQIAAILAAPDRATWSGHRDAVLLTIAYNTGARVSELTGLQVRDVPLDRQTAVHLHGKGRKQRAIPLWKNTATEPRGWLKRINSAPDAPVFPNRAGAPLTRSGVRNRLDRAVAAAEQRCPSLHGQHITPHTLRHSTAMHLLQSGTDLAVIALWLGHSSPAVTHQYLEADLAAKEAVLQRLADPGPTPTRFHPSDRLLAFLQGL
jgi:integrase